jgi:hypothetical protein
MKKKKIFRALRAAVEYFSTSAGVVSLIIGFIALAVVVPPFISIPIILVVGGVCAYVGGRRQWNLMKEREEKADVLDLEQQEVKREHDEALALNRNLDKRMAEIAEAEQKIQLKLDQHLELEYKHEIEHKQALERQLQECQQRERASETLIPYPHAIPSQSLTVSQQYHSAHRPQVTIRISNLPTFFMVDNGGGRNSPAHFAELQPQSEPVSELRSKSNVCP